MPFNTVSSSTRFICWASFSSCNQQAYSSTVLCLSKATLITRELASNHMFSSLLSTHQSPQAGSSHCTEPTVSDTMRGKRVSLISLSQPFVTELALLLSILQATWSPPYTGRCPISFTHREYCDDTEGVGNHASSPPSQFTLFYRNCQFQHLCIILQPFPVFAFQPKLSQMFSDAGRGWPIVSS